MLRGERDTAALTRSHERNDFYFSSDVGAREHRAGGIVARSLAEVDAMLSPTTTRLEFFALTTLGYSGRNRVHVRVEYYLQDWRDGEPIIDEPEEIIFYCAELSDGRWTLHEIMSY